VSLLQCSDELSKGGPEKHARFQWDHLGEVDAEEAREWELVADEHRPCVADHLR
jgi:hypothetical protein